jgi:hypothetical protein
MPSRCAARVYVLDREWFCKWFLGRRVWLTLGLMFHGNLQVLMNIGMFPPIMMSTYLFCLQGDEPGRILRFFGRGLAAHRRADPRQRAPRRAAAAGRGPHPPASHPRRAAASPPADLRVLALAAFGVVLQAGAAGAVVQARPARARADGRRGLHFGYTVVLAIAVILILAHVRAGAPRDARLRAQARRAVTAAWSPTCG